MAKHNYKYRKKLRGRTVYVENDNIEKAIRKLRRILYQNKIMEDYYDHCYYTKPSVKRRKRKAIGKFKARLWSQQQREKLEDFFIK